MNYIWITPKPEKGSLDEKYAMDVINSFIPRKMPLESTEKPVQEFSEVKGYQPSGEVKYR